VTPPRTGPLLTTRAALVLLLAVLSGLAAICLGSSLAWVALSPSALVFLAAMPYFGFAVVLYGIWLGWM